MMRAQLEDCRDRGEPVAYLWASEATIYGRFGYGLASRIGAATLARDRARVRAALRAARAPCASSSWTRPRSTFPPLYERVFAQRPGMFRAQQGVVGDPQRSSTTPPAGRAGR